MTANQAQASRAGKPASAFVYSTPIEHETPVPAAPLYWWTTAFLVSSFVGLTLAMLLFTPEVAAAAAERLHDALFYVERV